MSNDRYVAVTVLVEALQTNKTRYVASPVKGSIVWIGSVLDVTCGADTTLTPSINGVAITGGAVVHLTAGSAVGEVKQAKPTAANAVLRGDKISIAATGGSTGGQARVTLLIEQS
jgi:hypothetical protein